MHKKRLFIAGFFIFSLFLFVQAASAGCCIGERSGCGFSPSAVEGCEDPEATFTEAECGTDPRCDVVCCFDTTLGTSDAEYRVSCPSPSDRFVMFSPERIAPYEAIISSLHRDECRSCTVDLVKECPAGSTVPGVITAYCRIRPPETLGVYVPTGNTCPTAAPVEDRDGDGISDDEDVCPYERAITREDQISDTDGDGEPDERGLCDDGIDNDCDLRADSLDPDCAPPPGAPPPEAPLPEAEPTGFCGDGTVQTPNAAFFNEQCDWATSSPDETCGTGGTCRGDGDPRACTCEYACIAEPDVPLMLVPRRLALENEISWGLSSTCELAWFDIWRCEGTDCDPLSGHVVRRMPETLDPSGEARSFTYLDPIGPELEEMPMCYQIVAHYTNGVEVASEPVCTGAAPAECSRFSVPFCNDDRTAVVRCTEEGTAEDLCAPSEFCRELPGDTGCVAQSPCEQCNGFLGLFGFLDITIPADACNLLLSCAYDYSKSIVDKYHMCSQIDSCYDYNSQAACEADAEHCSVGREGCEWVPSPNAQAIGAGVCRPINEADQDCEACNAETGDHDNTYFKGCSGKNTPVDQQNCALYGFDRSLGTSGLSSCRLAPGPAGPWLCQNARDLGCQSYGADETACTGGTPVDVDVSYAAGVRDGVTNAITTRSNDAFRYGTCKFDPAFALVTRGGCFKDADGNGEPDCYADDFACQKDNTPPTTIVTAEDVPVRSDRRGDALLLGRSVDLDVSLSEQGTTFFCIDPPDGTSCYPQTETVCKLQRVLPSGTPGGMGTLRYYSKDDAQNLEVVTQIPVVLDTDAPAMNLRHLFVAEDRSLTITLSTTEEVTCNGILTDVHQGVVRAGRGSASTNAINAERGRSFSRTYYSVDDGVYLYQYTCLDEAGNRARNEESITPTNDAVIVVDTNRIHPETPAGILTDTGDQVLTIRTDADAECKYGPDQVSYDRMPHTFSSTGGTTHRATVTGCTNCFREWYVSCIFEGGVEEGNDQDVVRYSVDLAHPRVLAFNTLDEDVEFDSSTVYGSTQNIFFKCVDDDIKNGFGVIGYDFGCDTLTVTDGSTTLTAAGDDRAGPFLIRGRENDLRLVTLIATPTDRGGNVPPAPITIPVTIDRTDPELEITVRNTLTGDVVSPGTQRLGPLQYTIEARTIGVVSDVGASRAQIRDTTTGDLVADILLEETSRSVSSAEFSLDLNSIPGIESTLLYAVEIAIRATTQKASAACAPGEENVEPFEWTVRLPAFEFDPHLPTVTLIPLLDWRDGSPVTTGTSDYPGYPVYFYADEFAYYTNQTSIFVTGAVDDMVRTPEVLIWSGSGSDVLGGEPDVRVRVDGMASSALSAGSVPIIEPATTGAGSIHFGRGAVAGRYYRFVDADREEESHVRRSYGNYQRMYGADRTESTTAGTLAFLDGPLEGDVPPSVTGFTYQHGNKPWPPNWFGTPVPLREGENWVSIVAKSDTGITSISEYRRIIVDTNAPQVTESLPGPSDTSRAIDTISIVVRESKQGAPLLPESLALDLNGTIIGHEDLIIVSDDSDPEFVEYMISYTHDEPFNSTYHVRWIGHDKAANNLRSGAGLVEYDFTVGDGLPDRPRWDIIGAAEHEGVWYTSDVRAPFVVDFSEEASAVELVDVFFGIYEAEGLAPTRRSCTSSARNVFRCSYDPPLRPDEAYNIVVEARKTLTEGPGPIGRYTSPPVVVDNTPPVIGYVHYQDPIAEGVTLLIEIAVPTERWALQGDLYYAGDRRVHPLEMTGNDRAGRYVFTWDIPNYASGLIPLLERANPITITLHDYAGNAATPWAGTITLDMTPPSLLGFTFEPDVPFALADHYYTNLRTLRITGTFTDPDIDAVVITPGNFDDARGDFAPAAYASIRPDNTYEIILQLHGVENETTTTAYRYAVMDAAGNRVERPFQVTVDMTPPEEPSVTIS